MAEIKSAIEIAMERTQGFRLSAAEKEKLKEDEFHSRAQALVTRLRAGDLHFREVEKELARYSPEQRTRLEKIMVRELAEALDLDRDNGPVFQGIESLAPEAGGAVLKIKDLVGEYQQEKEAARAKAAEVLRAKWETLGISGPALAPKVAESPEFADALKAFQPSCEARLQALRNEIR